MRAICVDDEKLITDYVVSLCRNMPPLTEAEGFTRAEAFSILWEDRMYDRGMQKQLDGIIRSLRDTLEKHGIGEIFEMKKGALRIRPELISCDAWRFFKGDADAVNAYRGEYMSAYAWGEETEGFMSRKIEN